MSIRVVLSCNGKEGAFDCRQATPVGEVADAREARRVAAKVHGWSSYIAGTSYTNYTVFDLCQACTRRDAER